MARELEHSQSASVVPGIGDSVLLEAARQGDAEAVGVLYEKYSGQALRFARSLVRSESDASDVMHEAFTKTMNAIKNGKGPKEKFPAYLAAAVRSIAAEWWGRTSQEQPVEDYVLDHARGAIEDEGLSRVVEELGNQRLLDALATLPPRWQQALWYYDVLQEPPRRIAPIIGISPNAVSALVRRARRGLREAYGVNHMDDED